MSNVTQAECPRLFQPVTPPRNRAQTMGNWLESEETRKAFKRNAGFHWETPPAKELRYESSNANDYDPSSTSVDTYLRERPANERPVLSAPMKGTITSLNLILQEVKTLSARAAKTDTKMHELRENNRKTETELRKKQQNTETELRELHGEHNQLREDHEKKTTELLGFRDAYITPRLPLYQQNMIFDHVKKLYELWKASGNPQPPKSPKKSDTTSKQSKEHESLDRMEKKAKQINKQMLKYAQEHHGLRSEHLYIHLDIGNFHDARNAAAHETKKEFAVYLCSDGVYKAEQIYWYYSGLFPFVYGQTVEELAGRPDLLELEE